MINTNLLTKFMKRHQASGPKISIYMPTHRTQPDNKQDAILFKNLLQQSKDQLAESYPRRVWLSMVEQLEQLQKDSDFWNKRTEGLAVLLDESGLEVFELSHSPQQRLVVDEHFYLIPLMRHQGEHEAAYLIDLSKDRITFYRIEGEQAIMIEPEQIKTSFPEMFDDFDADSQVNFGSYKGGQVAYHGHRSKSEEQQKDREKYFRYLDQRLPEVVGNAPVIVAGVTENVTEFRKLAKSDNYLEQTIDKPFDSMDHEQQQEAIRNILTPHSKKILQKALARYDHAEAHGKASQGFDAIFNQSQAGQIDTLYLSADHGLQNERGLNELIQNVIRADGEVVLLDKTVDERHPISAILRF